MLSNRFSGALVGHLEEDVTPAVLEEVEGFLSVEGEHGEPVTGGHTVSKALNAVTWSSVRLFRYCGGKLGDSHDNVLATLEDTSVWGVSLRDQFHKSSSSYWMGSLYSTGRHGV